MTPWRRAVLAVATALLVGCAATEYAYVPKGSGPVREGAQVAAVYAIPIGTPQGELRVSSGGMVDVASQDGDRVRALRGLHVRFVVSDTGDKPWTFDTREQKVDLGKGPTAPAIASAGDASTPPVLTIPPGGKRTVDVFYPLPEDESDTSELPSFDVSWRVDTNGVVVADHTPFDRVEVDEGSYAGGYYYDTGYAYGVDYWVGPYWYNPVYPHYRFAGAVVIAPRYVGHPSYGGRRYYPHGGGFRGGGGFHGGGGHHR